MRLVLWDIDGTLVDTAGHGRAAFSEAFARLFERPPDDDDVPMAGRTDYAIALELLERNGVPDAEQRLPAMFGELHAALLRRRRVMADQGRPQPGVREALIRLGEMPELLQSPMTGNIEANARLKLSVFDLGGLVDFEIGGYGSESGARSELVDVARRKAERKHGVELPVAATVVVGDTPLDVEAARAAGARVVAVATGPYSPEELAEASADAVLEDMRDTGAVVEALCG